MTSDAVSSPALSVEEKRDTHDVVVLSSHRIVAECLTEILERRGFRVVEEIAAAQAAISDLNRTLPPYPEPPSNIPTLALVKGKGDDLVDLLARGYRGYVTGENSTADLVKALNAVAQGELWGERSVIAQLVTQPKRINLTPREQEVQELLIQGLTNGEIAQRLTISVSTVKAHVTSLLAKSGAKTRMKLIMKHKPDLYDD